MGHFHDTVRAVGKDRRDAEDNAKADFLFENGHRYDIREVESAELVRKVPPNKRIEEVRAHDILVTCVPDPSAPLSEWLEEWEFVLHSHA